MRSWRVLSQETYPYPEYNERIEWIKIFWVEESGLFPFPSAHFDNQCH